jgi:hypothetical protein
VDTGDLAEGGVQGEGGEGCEGRKGDTGGTCLIAILCLAGHEI